MAFWKIAGAAGIASLSLSGCGDSGDDTTTTAPMPTEKSIAEVVVATEDLSTLAAALTAANLVDTFKDENAKFTVFAPTNDAFDALSAVSESLLTCLLKPTGVSMLTNVLKYHVVAEVKMAASLESGSELPTILDNYSLNVTIDDGTVKINNATVVKADMNASNGVVHEIDEVLIPMPIFKAPDCGSGDLAALVTSVKTLSTLATALTAAELVPTFSCTDNDTDCKGPFTVFAPTDDAFTKVPNLNCYLQPENKGALTSLLEYHVLPSYVLAADIKNEDKQVTLDDNETLTFVLKGETVEIVNGNRKAKVTNADNFANDGVAHIIDEVLLPSNANCTSADFTV